MRDYKFRKSVGFDEDGKNLLGQLIMDELV
jgi:hypothetical protein